MEKRKSKTHLFLSLGEKGTIRISGYFDDFFMEGDDDKVNPQVVILAKAMEFALENLNSTFRFEAIFNTRKTHKSISSISNHSVFAIGPMYPGDFCYQMKNDGTFVSYYSSNEHLSDSDGNVSSVFSIVPENSFRIRALLHIVRKMEWKYVTIISSCGEHGRTAADDFSDRIKEANSCVDYHLKLRLKKNRKKFKEIEKLNSSAIISFTMGLDTVNVIKHLPKEIQVIFAFGTIFYEEIASERYLSKKANGTLFFDFHAMDIPNFSEFVCQNNCNNSRNRRLEPIWCDGNSLRIQRSGGIPAYTSYNFTPVHLVIKAVNALVNAIESSAKDDIKYFGLKARQKLVRKHLRKNTVCAYSVIRYDIIKLVTYEQDKLRYKTTLNKIGSWTSSGCDDEETGKLELNISDIVWMSESGGKTNKNLSGLSCQQNEIQERIEEVISRKCWKCRTCENNEIVYNNTCKACSQDSKPDKSFRSCIILPRKTLNVKSNWQAKIILAFSLASLAPVFFVALVFLKYRNSKVVKASGRELCTFILIGNALTFMVCIIFVNPPGKVICSLRQILPGFAFCLCYAPLFLKVNRIYRIFANSENCEKTYMASPRSQSLLVLGIAAVQLIPGCVWIVKSIPDITIEYPDHKDYVVIHCPIDHPGFFLNVFLGFIFMLGSTWYAFKTRTFPRNFNESKYIGISLYIICLFWALFVPAYFIVKPSSEFVHEYMMCNLCIMIGYTMLAGLFMPKVRRLLFWSHQSEHGLSVENSLSTPFIHSSSVEIHQRNTKSASKAFNASVSLDTELVELPHGTEEMFQRTFSDQETQTELVDFLLGQEKRVKKRFLIKKPKEMKLN